MHGAELLLRDLALVLSVAAAVTVLFRMLKQPPVLGYLLAGTLIGPYVPFPLSVDSERVGTLSELGVILVMFAIGLEFSLRRVAKLIPTAGITGAIQLSGMFWLGYATGQLLGWSLLESLFVGAMIAISSTMIVARTFIEEKTDKRTQEVVFGVLIVQDLAAVVLLAVLTALAHGGAQASADAGGTVARTAGELAGFLLVAVLVGFLTVPRVFRRIARLKSPETLLVASVGFCFATALLAHHVGYSVALGAFLAGTLVAESGHAHEIEKLVIPLRDLFAAVFFVAVGMILDPAALVDHWQIILLLSAIVLIAQPTLVTVGTFLAGTDVRTSIRAGMSLGQIGEFSFIIAGVGVGAGVIGPHFYPVAIAVSVITSFATPFMVRYAPKVASGIERRLPHSVQTFTSLYASWREELRTQRTHGGTAARIRRLIGLIAIDGAILTALPIAASIVHDRYLDRVRNFFGVPESAGLVLLVALTVLVATPFAIALFRAVRGLGGLFAGIVLPNQQPGALDLAAAPRRAFVVALQLAMFLIVGLPFLAVTQPFLPSFLGLPLLIVVLAILGFAFWRSANNLEGHVQAGAELVLQTLARTVAPAATATPLSEVQAVLPGLGRLTACTLPANCPAVGRTLIELNLRGLTGASVIAIAGSHGAIAAPTGRERLHAGDVLSLTGESAAVDAAITLLLASPESAADDADDDDPRPRPST